MIKENTIVGLEHLINVLSTQYIKYVRADNLEAADIVDSEIAVLRSAIKIVEAEL